MSEVLGLPDLLAVLALLGSGITMGVFFAVAVSVAPALLSMPPDRYVEAHRLLGKGYHPAMPIITNVTMFACVGLAFLAPQPGARWLYAAGAAATLGVQAVSHLANVPINRQLAAAAQPSQQLAATEQLAAAGQPSGGWEDPRPEWRFWHLIRTALAAVALVGNSVAVTLAN